MANRHGDFIWYELLTSDADAAQPFYSRIFGWQLKDSGQAAMDYRIISASEGEIGGLLQLTDDMQAGGARPVWIGYIGVDDVDETVDAIVQTGGAVLKPAWDIPTIGRLAMVADAQGAPFCVMRGTSDVESHAFAYDRPRLGHCAWNELTTADPSAAIAFYGELFGWEKNGEMDMGPMGAYQFLRRASVEGPFAGVMSKPAEMPVSLWNFYFRVADIDEAARQTRAGGGQIIVEPAAIPGGEFSAKALDPQGALFSFVGPRR